MAVEPIERSPGKWLYDYTDPYGRRKWGTAESADTARTIQAQRQNEWRLIKSGVLKPEQVAQGRAAAKPITVHILAYEEHLKAKGNGARYVREAVQGLERVVGWLNVGAVEAIAADRVEAVLNRKMEAGIGPRMRNFYVKLLKAFLQLLEDHEAIARNQLRKLKSINEDTDQRNVSRPMTHAEFAALLKALELPVRKAGEEIKLTAEQRDRQGRRLYYLFGARAGMRWAETARLRYQDVDTRAWWLKLVARNTKGKRADSLPIPTDLAEAVTEWVGAHPDAKGEDLLFPAGTPSLRTWKRDLVRAGLVKVDGKYLAKVRKGKKAKDGYKDVYAATEKLGGYTDADGYKLHRKCLRLTFGTWLYEAGVDVREAQRLMRHRDINLTSSIYTRPRMSNLQAAAEKVAEARKAAAKPLQKPPQIKSAG